MRINDALLGLIILAVSIFIIVVARTFPALPGVPYGPGVFPTIIAGCMLLGGVILVGKGIRQLPETGWIKLDPWAKTVRSYLTLGIIFAALLFYILFSDTLGFIITCVLILLALLFWTRGHKRMFSSLIISVSFALIIYLVFVKFMRVPLPGGLLLGIF